MDFKTLDLDDLVNPLRADLIANQDADKNVARARRDGVSPLSHSARNRWGDELHPDIIAAAVCRLEETMIGSADAIAADLATPRHIPTKALSEFHPPRFLRGLEITLAPRLLPVPDVRSCHV